MDDLTPDVLLLLFITSSSKRILTTFYLSEVAFIPTKMCLDAQSLNSGVSLRSWMAIAGQNSMLARLETRSFPAGLRSRSRTSADVDPLEVVRRVRVQDVEDGDSVFMGKVEVWLEERCWACISSRNFRKTGLT